MPPRLLAPRPRSPPPPLSRRSFPPRHRHQRPPGRQPRPSSKLAPWEGAAGSRLKDLLEEEDSHIWAREGQRRCWDAARTRITARSSRCSSRWGSRNPDASARPAPRSQPHPRPLGPSTQGAESRGLRREAGRGPRALLPPPEPARGERRANARRAAAALGGVRRAARGAAGAKLRGPDARGRGGAARLPLLPLRAPGASPQAALPAARRVHRASEGMCGGRGWSCRRRRRRTSRS